MSGDTGVSGGDGGAGEARGADSFLATAEERLEAERAAWVAYERALETERVAQAAYVRALEAEEAAQGVLEQARRDRVEANARLQAIMALRNREDLG